MTPCESCLVVKIHAVSTTSGSMRISGRFRLLACVIKMREKRLSYPSTEFSTEAEDIFTKPYARKELISLSTSYRMRMFYAETSSNNWQMKLH
ncbi:hypothetical protein Tco_1482973 [Tanacetum coccineum]